MSQANLWFFAAALFLVAGILGFAASSGVSGGVAIAMAIVTLALGLMASKKQKHV